MVLRLPSLSPSISVSASVSRSSCWNPSSSSAGWTDSSTVIQRIGGSNSAVTLFSVQDVVSVSVSVCQHWDLFLHDLVRDLRCHRCQGWRSCSHDSTTPPTWFKSTQANFQHCSVVLHPVCNLDALLCLIHGFVWVMKIKTDFKFFWVN